MYILGRYRLEVYDFFLGFWYIGIGDMLKFLKYSLGIISF